jgi:hypothetical protein
MIKRLLRIGLSAISLLGAAALVVLQVHTASQPVILNSARGGTYRELRASDGRFSYLAATTWATDSPLTLSSPQPQALEDHDFFTLDEDRTMMMTVSARRSFWPVELTTGNIAVGSFRFFATGNSLTATFATSAVLVTPTSVFERYAVQQWVVIVLMLTPALWITIRTGRRWWLARIRRRRGLCMECGYDLRGGGGVCPECGAVSRSATASLP